MSLISCPVQSQLPRWHTGGQHAKHKLSPSCGISMDIDSYAKPIIDFVQVHSVWAAPVVFVLCFAESLVFISLLIPAWAALVGIGTLIGASNLNFWPIWIAGS